MMLISIMLYFTNATADSGIGESVQNIESPVFTSSSRLSDDNNFQSPEIGKLLATLMVSV